jgi:protein ImuB
VPYQERLLCLEPIITLTGIEIPLEELLRLICGRLGKKQKGVRALRLKCHRVDDKIIEVEIGTYRPSRNCQTPVQII